MVKEYLESLPSEDINDIYQNIQLGMHPAKQEDSSCIFATCRYPNNECDNCPFVIHHIYSLSVLGPRLKYKISNFNEKFQNAKTDGTKTKLANSLYGDMDLLKMAIKKFGEDTVSQFMVDTDINDLRTKSGEIDSVREYYTLGRA